MKASPRKTGLYFTHYECFGHTSRAIAVAQAVKKRSPDGDVFFIQTGAVQTRAMINRIGKVYPLPQAPTERPFLKEPAFPMQEQTEQRTRACMDLVARENPDFFITEFFPIGNHECRHELIPSLIKMSAQGTPLWAVAGYPLLTGTDDGWRQKILRLYQQVLIFSPPQEKEFVAGLFSRPQEKQRYLEFFDRHAAKTKFAGYLLPQSQVALDDEDTNRPKPPAAPGACRVAVLRGGGAVYPKVIAQAIRASDLLGKEYYVTVVAGPSTSSEEWYFFNTLMGQKKIKNLVLLRSAGDYEGLVKSSDVCVSLASYHTSVMLLKYKKKSVLVPFEGYGRQSIREQPARALMLQETIGARILSIDHLTADGLAAAIRETARRSQNNVSVPQEWFTGAEVLDRTLTGLFGP
ncbi:MAG: hypothetical protein KGJ95_02760 [Candidatus Omnitrophica bacterium]|nr:hypothetical protein [Candidatus Omnitrophota bacterium]